LDGLLTLVPRMLVSDAQAVRRGMQRHLYLVIDCSKGMYASSARFAYI
jgi:hypothetical protein